MCFVKNNGSFISVLAFFFEGAISQINPQILYKLTIKIKIKKVLRVGIEPTLFTELDFESSASTNSATEAKDG